MRNDLTKYNTVKDSLVGGDLIFFDGSDDKDLTQLVDHLVPNAIEFFTRSNWSHVAMVVEPSLLINGQKQKELNLIESTLSWNVNGPRITPLEEYIESYDGCNISFFPLQDWVRKQINWPILWKYALERVGKNHYSIKGIIDFLLRPIFPFIPWFHKPDPNAETCSEFIAEMFKASGFCCIDTHEASPETLARLPNFYKTPIQVV